MVYEGNVKIISDDGKTFTFNSPDGVAWLQMYVDMFKAGTRRQRRRSPRPTTASASRLFSSRAGAVLADGPNLIRDVKSNNPALYDNLAVVPAPVGKSGVVGKGSMGISVKADTKFPNASIALAQFFTNPRSMVAFSKIVSIYPSSAAAYDDPFFSAAPTAIEDAPEPIAKDIVSKYADIVPTVPKKADVNQIVLNAIEQALAGKLSAQDALTTRSPSRTR